ncbi:MAG: hypothetical protein QF885_06625 [Candidatus Thalassarchaeaceae archaeon]|jgi:hypothetical protein|nr:hypothetical protein [Candidatus Thalassarchaeaceae archaeon]MDP7008895.1 hypothetical protein [Phycisphaerales bacterium]
MIKIIQSTAILLIAVANGCQSDRLVVMDQRPDYISKEQTKSTVRITFRDEEGFRFGGSAVILGSNSLLTNRHIWVHEKEWWKSEPLPEQEIGVFYTCASCDKLHVKPQTFELVCVGEVDLGLESNNEALLWARKLSDWAVINTQKPSWNEKNVAVIHTAAMDPNWMVPEGTELYIFGFSGIFKNNESQDEQQNEDFATKANAAFSFTKNGPYAIASKAVCVKGHPAIIYNSHWPTPYGHSGGGVYLWNTETERLELVGVFHSESNSQLVYNFFNLMRFPLKKSKILFYSPIALALQALKTDKE